jgi:N-formylglutamate amidohydrolase
MPHCLTPSRRILPGFAACLILLDANLSVNAQTNLVYARRGDLPIILTAPHGGSSPIPGVKPRTNDAATTVQDSRTFELATEAAKRIEELLGRKPYVVAAQFHRRFLDVNRPEADALESNDAKPVYAAFHSQVKEFVTEIRKKYPHGALLLDIHGQKKDVTTIHRGTQNGTTVMKMLERQGLAAFTGTNSILGHMAVTGITVFPPNTPPGKPAEEKGYGGGYIVRTYGSHKDDGIDAIQLEFGTSLRDASVVRTKTAPALAEAVQRYYNAFLKDSAK